MYLIKIQFIIFKRKINKKINKIETYIKIIINYSEEIPKVKLLCKIKNL